jgi:hypothetical protein
MPATAGRAVSRGGRVEAKISFDPDKAVQYLGDVDRKMPAAIGVAVRLSIFDMVTHVTKSKLLGQYLHRVTGTLIKSVTASPAFQTSAARVRGIFGSHLDYARAHEEGFSGTVTVKAHFRRVGTQKGSFFTGIGGKHVTRVREHPRHMDITAKHFLHDTVFERSAQAGINVRKAIFALAESRKVPTLNQVRAQRVSLNQLRAF